MAKNDKFYFENFIECAKLSEDAALYLEQCLENYNERDIGQMLDKMHEIEHSADGKKHQMSEALAKAFVTPIDREDLDLLSHKIDDVIDLIEEVLQKFYVYDIKSVSLSVIEFAKAIVKACGLISDIACEFENFKKPKKLRSLIVELNDVEEECDKLYISAMRAVTTEVGDDFKKFSNYKILESFERCADACEHVGECVASVVMKNT